MQLADVARHAHDMFEELQQESARLAARTKVQSNLQTLVSLFDRSLPRPITVGANPYHRGKDQLDRVPERQCVISCIHSAPVWTIDFLLLASAESINTDVAALAEAQFQSDDKVRDPRQCKDQSVLLN